MLTKACARLVSYGLIYFELQVFLNRAQLIRGSPAFVKAKVAEHLWVTKEEIREYLGESIGEYLKHVL